MIICITGSSGVGKTTFSQIIGYLFPQDSVLHISGDDLHKWERNDTNWEYYTHLNPEANNLDKGIEDIKLLKSGKSIFRKIYNHDTGKFTDEQIVNPKDIIIYEGLHTLYDKEINHISDLNIFIDTDPSLKIEWKIKRDTKKRGYTKEQVLSILEKRKQDEINYINPQINNADIIIRFIKYNEKIICDYNVLTDKGKNNLHFIEKSINCYNSLIEFIDLSKYLIMDYSLMPSRGGNISVKYDKSIIISSSGKNIKDITFNDGYCICNQNVLQNYYKSETDYNQSISSSILMAKDRPSMELGFHKNIKDKVVLHCHPIYLNTILCSQECEFILDKLFEKDFYTLIDYETPGYKLSNLIQSISPSTNVIMLKNHGLIISGNYLTEVQIKMNYINDICKEWIKLNTNIDFIDTNHYNSKPLFPDAAVLPDETMTINNYIIGLMEGLQLTPNYLTDDNIKELNGLNSERYRKTL